MSDQLTVGDISLSFEDARGRITEALQALVADRLRRIVRRE
jgi:hypothetical protein